MHTSCTELRHHIQHSVTSDLYPKTMYKSGFIILRFWCIMFRFRIVYISFPYQLENINWANSDGLSYQERNAQPINRQFLCRTCTNTQEKRKDDLLVLRRVTRPVSVRGICSGNLFSFVYEAFQEVTKLSGIVHFLLHCKLLRIF